VKDRRVDEGREGRENEGEGKRSGGEPMKKRKEREGEGRGGEKRRGDPI